MLHERAGRIEQNGTPVELYEHPANTFVARFIGTPPMNLLPLERGRGGAVIAGTDGPAVLPADCAAGMLGVRPEHIAARVRTRRSRDASTASSTWAAIRSSAAGSAAQPLAVRVPGSVGLARGDTTWLRWAPGAQHYFDADGGARRSTRASRRQRCLA